MSRNPYEATLHGSAPPRPRSWLKIWGGVLGGVAIVFVLICMLLPAVRTSREAPRRSSCSNNLKQIGLALHNYHDTHGAFPPAYTVDAEGKPLHSWRTLILPFVERSDLYESIDLSKPWDDPVNADACNTALRFYRCPSSTDRPKGDGLLNTTNYLAVVTPNSCLQAGHARQMSEIADGTSSTLVVFEVPADRAVPWMSPQDADEATVLALTSDKLHPHPAGAQVLLADASVRLLPPTISPNSLRAWISIAGNDKVAAEDE